MCTWRTRTIRILFHKPVNLLKVKTHPSQQKHATISANAQTTQNRTEQKHYFPTPYVLKNKVSHWGEDELATYFCWDLCILYYSCARWELPRAIQVLLRACDIFWGLTNSLCRQTQAKLLWVTNTQSLTDPTPMGYDKKPMLNLITAVPTAATPSCLLFHSHSHFN